MPIYDQKLTLFDNLINNSIDNIIEILIQNEFD